MNTMLKLTGLTTNLVRQSIRVTAGRGYRRIGKPPPGEELPDLYDKLFAGYSHEMNVEDISNITDLSAQGDLEHAVHVERSMMREADNIRRNSWKYAVKKLYQPKGAKEPCLLTYEMKLRIIQLHQDNPVAWTPERISQSFPISYEGTLRFLKSKEKNYTPEQIEKHDQLVLRNWSKYTKGEFGHLALLKKYIKAKKKEEPKILDPETERKMLAEVRTVESFRKPKGGDVRKLKPWYNPTAIGPSCLSIIKNYETKLARLDEPISEETRVAPPKPVVLLTPEFSKDLENMFERRKVMTHQQLKKTKYYKNRGY